MYWSRNDQQAINSEISLTRLILDLGCIWPSWKYCVWQRVGEAYFTVYVGHLYGVLEKGEDKALDMKLNRVTNTSAVDKFLGVFL